MSMNIDFYEHLYCVPQINVHNRSSDLWNKKETCSISLYI